MFHAFKILPFLFIFFSGRNIFAICLTKPDSLCDEITLVSGQVVYGRVLEIGKEKIKILPCNNFSASVTELSDTSVFFIRYHGSKSLKVINSYPHSSKQQHRDVLLQEKMKKEARRDSMRLRKKDSLETNDPRIKGQLFISGGVGESNLLYSSIFFFKVNPMGSNKSNCYGSFIKSYPEYTISLDYGLNRRISLGAAICFQTLTSHLDMPRASEIETLSRLIVAIRVVWHTQIFNGLGDLYYGMRGGFSYWTDNFPNSIALDCSLLGSPSELSPSFRLLAGARFFFSNTFGIHGEIGGMLTPDILIFLADPYIEGGLTVRLSHHRAKGEK